MSRLAEQVKQAVAAFSVCRTPPALIGGLALAAHQVVRATRDVDFLADSADADRLHETLLALGYRCIHRSEDAANYVRGDEGLDLLYAHRPASRRLLSEAQERETPLGRLRVTSAEGLIGFKLQALVNDPARGRDLDDIRALLRALHDALNMREVRDYFACSTGWNCSMGCSPKSKGVGSPAGILAGSDFPADRAWQQGDYSTWIELMEVVEALCPVWPERAAIREEGAVYKL